MNFQVFPVAVPIKASWEDYEAVIMKKIWIIFLLFGVMSCTDDLDYLASIIESEEDSDSRYRRGRSTRSTNHCEDSSRCKDICDQILDYSSERRDCYRLSLKEIGIIEEVFDDLQAPLDYLDDVRGGNFDLFASIALKSWSNLIRGEYRRDEEHDDDDDDMDDGGREAYNNDEAEEVLTWIIGNTSVAESIQDFSEREDGIIADLLIQMDDSLSCSGGGDNAAVCGHLDSSLTTPEKRFLANIKNKGYLDLAVRVSSSSDDVSAVYGLVHESFSRICENVDSLESYGSEKSYKICLSWVYFCPSVYDDISKYQIDQYLLEDTYRSVPESSLSDCSFFTDEPRWTDYWN